MITKIIRESGRPVAVEIDGLGCRQIQQITRAPTAQERRDMNALVENDEYAQISASRYLIRDAEGTVQYFVDCRDTGPDRVTHYPE